MAVLVIPRIERGRLYFQTADVCFLPSLSPRMTAGIDEQVQRAAASDAWATEGAALRASLRMARVLVQETFEDLQAASARDASEGP